MSITQIEAWVFLPFVLPICLYVAYRDMAEMLITNKTVLLLAAVFVVLGLIALPFDAYLWRLAQLVIVLIVGMVLNAAGGIGGGDAKFCAAAAPFVALGDLRMLIVVFMAALIAAYAVHRFAKHTPLRRLAPDWQSWQHVRDFPMGLALGPSLAMYLGLGALLGS